MDTPAGRHSPRKVDIPCGLLGMDTPCAESLGNVCFLHIGAEESKKCPYEYIAPSQKKTPREAPDIPAHLHFPHGCGRRRGRTGHDPACVLVASRPHPAGHDRRGVYCHLPHITAHSHNTGPPSVNPAGALQLVLVLRLETTGLGMSCPPHIDWARRCVALDDSHSTPCLLRATRSGRKVTFESWVQHHGTPPDEKAPIVAASPVRDCFARWVDVPLTPLRKGLRVLASALDVVLPFPIESCSYHVLCAMETPEGKTRALTVGAREEALYARLGTLATAGTPPLVLDHEGVALWTQGVVEHPPQEESLRGIVHLADQRAVLTIGRGQDLIATYALRPLAPATLNRLLNATLVDMPELKDATIEWLWVGPLSGDPSTLAPLQAAAEEGGKAAHLNNEAPETFLARGLATRALLPGPMRCNLLQGELEPVAFAKRKRRRSLARALGGTYGLPGGHWRCRREPLDGVAA